MYVVLIWLCAGGSVVVWLRNVLCSSVASVRCVVDMFVFVAVSCVCFDAFSIGVSLLCCMFVGGLSTACWFNV